MVAIPVTLTFGGAPGSGADPDTDPYSPVTESTVTTSTAPTRTTTSVEPRRSPTTTTTTSESDLTDKQQDLFDRVSGGGIIWSSCEGHPNGEDITGVTAAIQCNTGDLDLKIGILQFRSAGTAEDWLNSMTGYVDNPGECSAGEEESTTWSNSGIARGPLICIDETVRGDDYWRIIWSFFDTGVVMLIGDTSADTAYQWWQSHANFDVS